jgi:hypothetical protein
MVACNTRFVWPRAHQKIAGIEPKRNTQHNDIKTPSATVINTDMGLFLGGLLADGDGDVDDDRIEWESMDQDSADLFFKTASRLFGVDAVKIHEHKTRAGLPLWRIQIHRKDVIKLIQSINGMRNRPVGKFIPDLIMQSPKEVVTACLRGMFDGNGIVKHQVYYTTRSHEMATRLQLLLQRLNIRARLSKPNASYRVTITGADNIKKFRSTIGFIAQRKNSMLDNVLNNAKPTETKVPFVSEWLISNGRKDLAHGVASARRKKSDYVRDCVKSRLPWLAKQLPSHKDVIEQLVAFDWCEVTDVSYAGKEPVYDLTVDETHSYVANGTIAHNSNNCWIWTMPGEESETSIMEVKQLKARNQQRFGFQLLSHNSSMLITDVDDVSTEGTDDDEDEEDTDEYKEAKDGKKGKMGKSDGNKEAKAQLRDLNDDEDEDEDEDEEDEN